MRGTGVYGMSVAGAAAREMLLAAAAGRFGVPAAECKAVNSRVVHEASGKSATFGELAADAARQSVPSRPPMKDPATYTIRRTARQRFDIRTKVDGSAIYGIDFSTPGMLCAAVEMAPVSGGKLLSVDSAAAEAMPGVKRVVRLENAVAVVADTYWHARKAHRRTRAEIRRCRPRRGVDGLDFRRLRHGARRAPGDCPARRAKVVKADYKVPFLAHATMEPMVCTVRVEGDRADVWAGVQDPLNARATAAQALGLDAEQVRVTNLALGGGFGRRLPFYLDYVDLAARIAKEMSPAPVKVVWSRENDIQHDFYRPAAMARFAGGARRQRQAGRHPVGLRRRRRRRVGVHALRDRQRRRRARRRRIRFRPVRGARSSTRSTGSSRSRSSTSWRMPPARIRSSSGAIC